MKQRFKKAHPRQGDEAYYDGKRLYLHDHPRVRRAAIASIFALAAASALAYIPAGLNIGFIEATIGFVVAIGVITVLLVAAESFLPTFKTREHDLMGLDGDDGKHLVSEDSDGEQVEHWTVDVDVRADGTVYIVAQDVDVGWVFPGQNGVPSEEAFWVFEDSEAGNYGITSVDVRRVEGDDEEVQGTVSECGEWELLNSA